MVNINGKFLESFLEIGFVHFQLGLDH